MTRKIIEETLEIFRERLIQDEKRKQTIEKYLRDVGKLKEYLAGRSLTKEVLIEYKEYLQNCGKYKVASINSFLAAANHFCEVMGWTELRIKMIKVQREVFVPEYKELTYAEYERLVQTANAQGNERLGLILQTLAGTGIRISELKYITAESLGKGMTEIHNKGKVRSIMYPTELVRMLKEYTQKQGISTGRIFCTRTGAALDRSNIWRSMKKLCKDAKVDEEKVYPHNMRHLFARCFYKIKNDIAKLADVLGHSNIETTRIYIKSTGKEHKKQLDMMRMILSERMVGNKKRQRRKLTS